MKTIVSFEIDEEYKPLLQAAAHVIQEVMEAGRLQREAHDKPTNEWLSVAPEKRIHHAFMHMVACMKHVGTSGNPYSITDNTALEDYKHAFCGLAIVAARNGGFVDTQETIDE